MKKLEEKSKYGLGRGAIYQIKTLIFLCSFCFKSKFTELLKLLLLFNIKSLFLPTNHTLGLAPSCPLYICELTKITLIGEGSLCIIFWGCPILTVCLINKRVFSLSDFGLGEHSILNSHNVWCRYGIISLFLE